MPQSNWSKLRIEQLDFCPQRIFEIGDRKPVVYILRSWFKPDVGDIKPPPLAGLSDELFGVLAEPISDPDQADLVCCPGIDVLLCFPPRPGSGRYSDTRPTLFFWNDAFWTHALHIGYSGDVAGMALDIIYQVRVLDIPKMSLDEVLDMRYAEQFRLGYN